MTRRTPSSVCLTALVIALVSGCTRNSTQGDSWHKDWEIVVNGTEPNVDQDGHIPLGWHAGEIGGDMVNRPVYEGPGLHTGLLYLHPLSIHEPARIRCKKELPFDVQHLMVLACGNVNGDCLLRCLVNGNDLGDCHLSGTEWTECLFDLSAFAGQAVELELLNIAGGDDDWHFEHCFIDQIKFESQ